MAATELEELIRKCLQDFYRKRLEKVSELKLAEVLPRKNPYLLRALATEKASEIVEQILAAYLGASDESIFGDTFFEPIARIASGGTVADGKGVDFVLEHPTRFVAVAVKSGPNPFNASQKEKQSQEFAAVRNRLLKIQKQFDPILAHSYGRANTQPTTSRIYRDLSGKRFWHEMTGDSDFYLKLVRLMKEAPAIHKQEYRPAWDAAVNRLTVAFAQDFCLPDGRIDWEKLVKFVSEDLSPSEAKKKYLAALVEKPKTGVSTSRSQARRQKS